MLPKSGGALVRSPARRRRCEASGDDIDERITHFLETKEKNATLRKLVKARTEEGDAMQAEIQEIQLLQAARRQGRKKKDQR